MKRGTIWLILAAVFSLAGGLKAGEEPEKAKGGERGDDIVVTAHRGEVAAGEVGGSLTVIRSGEIEVRQVRTVADILRSQRALDVVRQGPLGGNTSVFIRGAPSEHTLVLVDGIRVNDPITSGRAFNFADLSLDNVERIEVLRGPQSTLYGSDALGGVINIITRAGDEGWSGRSAAEGGSFGTARERVSLNGGGAGWDLALAASRQDSEGFSAAGEQYGNREDDGWSNTSFSARAGLEPSEALRLEGIFRFSDSAADLDGGGGAGGDDPNYRTATRQYFARGQARLDLADGDWRQTLGASLVTHDRRFDNEPDDAHPLESERSTYWGERWQVDWQHDLVLGANHVLTVGGELAQEAGEFEFATGGTMGSFVNLFTEETATSGGGFLQDRFQLADCFFGTVGVRLDEHDRFGTAVTGRAAPVFLVNATGTRLHGSIGTGFKSPSLFQLYSVFGDRELDPERSLGWDAGVEQPFCDGRLTLGALFFRNEFEDLIEYDVATFRFGNVAEATTQGCEATALFSPCDYFDLELNYTYTDTEDETTGLDLIRRARHRFSVTGIARLPEERGQFSLGLVRVGERDDRDFTVFPARRVELDAYVVVNASGSLKLAENLDLTVRVENVFDEEYEEAFGYGSPRFGAFAGLELSF